MKNILFSCVFLSIITSSLVFAAIGDWTTYTNKGDIREIKVVGDTIWCATNGGIFKFNFADSTFEDFTNTNGLASIDVTTMEIDNNGNVWAGMSNGYINVYQSQQKRWETITDIIESEPHEIYDFEIYGDSLYIGLDEGISLYHRISDKKKREVKATYQNLGTSLGVLIPVKKIHIHNKEIWAATDNGLARSNITYINLKDPKFWTNYTTNNSNIPSNKIQDIASLNDDIYIATDQGIAKFDGKTWTSSTGGISAVNIYALHEDSGTLYAASENGVYQLVDERWNRLGEHVRNVTSLACDKIGDIWASRSKTSSTDGFSHYEKSTGIWKHISPPGPCGNTLTNLTIDKNGVLWCCTRFNGICKFDGRSWITYKADDYKFASNNFQVVRVDSYNNKWFGSWGNGIIKVDTTENITIYGNQELSAIENYPDYVVISDLAIDSQQNIWALNYAAADGAGLAVTAQGEQWQYFSAEDGLLIDASVYVHSMLIDKYSRIWVGTEDGISVIDPNLTPFDKSDDNFAGTLTKNDGLINNKVVALAEDLDGIIWIGTPQGVNYWQGGAVYDKTGTIHDNIQAIEVDVRNNKWFGTVEGVSVLSADNFTWTNYTTENSSIVGSNITCFTFDEITGKVYIGTTSGLSVLETPYAKAESDVETITAGPNPYIINNGNAFTLYKLADDVSIKFMTINGRVIKNVSKDKIQGFYEWHGENDNEEIVGSGIYLYLIYNEALGTSKVGKVAVVRE